jgi:hypothetical protein
MPDNKPAANPTKVTVEILMVGVMASDMGSHAFTFVASFRIV